MKLVVVILGVLAAFLFILGCLFKVLHYEGANQLLLFCSMVLLILVPCYAVYWYRKK
jgi:hypothetical protein